MAARRLERLDWLAATLVVAVFAALLVPLCTMPACEDTTAGSCSDFQPACGDCPETVVMKHTPDDAVASAAPTFGELALIAQLDLSAEPVAVEPVAAVPDATAAPPPLDPLGVRLTV